jgi:hypothetical protein
MDYESLLLLGVEVIEGEHPGSTYYAADLRIGIEEANAAAEAARIPARFIRAPYEQIWLQLEVHE